MNPPQQLNAPAGVETHADSLKRGIALMLALTIVQRAVGFIRNVLVCRYLDPADLGEWNLAFSFLETAAPLVILGVPGCFARYVEHFRQKSQLRSFLRKTTIVSALCTVLGAAVLFVFRRQVAWFAFGSTAALELFLMTLATLFFVVAYNFCIELLNALRLVRWNAYLQFINSIVFTLVSLLLLISTQFGAQAVLMGYFAACVVATVVAMVLLWKVVDSALPDREPLGPKALWFRIGPFIGWLWISNFLTNMFCTVDRLMIVHLSGAAENAAYELVGQFHSSRIIGTLLISVVGTLSGILLSYSSHDWESGRKDTAARRLEFSMKLVALSMTAISILSLVGAPVLFGWALNGKYMDGFQLLPATLAYCVWFGLIYVTTNFIWCNEKPHLACIAVGVGLAINIVLNFWWVPIWQLEGAVAATTIANFATLAFSCLLCRRLGMRIGRGTLVSLSLPGILCWGALVATAVWIAILWHGVYRRWLFDDAESKQLVEIYQSISGKILKTRITLT